MFDDSLIDENIICGNLYDKEIQIVKLKVEPTARLFLLLFCQ